MDASTLEDEPKNEAGQLLDECLRIRQAWREATAPLVGSMQEVVDSLTGMDLARHHHSLRPIVKQLNAAARELGVNFRESVGGTAGKLVWSASTEPPALRLCSRGRKARRMRSFPRLTIVSKDEARTASIDCSNG